MHLTFPLPVEHRYHPDAAQRCKWCGTHLTDRRRRYCCKEHERAWVEQVLLREAWWYQRKQALKRDKYACRHCGLMAKKGLHVHHIVPRSQGGSNYVDNLLTLCKECHIEVHRHDKSTHPHGAHEAAIQKGPVLAVQPR
jgi:5-methylcytosine-specific restriction endonuclease McrA